MQRIFINKCFLFKVGSVCRVKRFTTGSRNSLKDVRKSLMMPDQGRKWLRQQSKDFNAAGFDALVERWDKCIYVGGGYVEKYRISISHVLCFYIYFWLIYWLFLVYIRVMATHNQNHPAG
jgi:hypothetical protein